MNLPSPKAHRELAALSCEIGQDVLLVQGAGGNTSIKADGVLWVKASGKWLADARREPVFVPVGLEGVRNRIAADEADPVTEEIAAGGPAGLRPSIETTLHALLPQPVVVHVHCLRTLAWAVRRDGAERVGERLDGLRWCWIEYHRPGLPLTRAVAQAIAGRPIDILVLANHGLVVGAGSCGGAHHLLQEVMRRLDQPPRQTPPPDCERLAALAEGQVYALPRHSESHRLALDSKGLGVAGAGSLYPDHVVFLGPGLAILPEGAPLDQLRTPRGRPAAIAVPGAGVLVRKGLSAGAEEMLRALALLVTRVSGDAKIAYLTPEEESALGDWDAEKYRIALSRG